MKKAFFIDAIMSRTTIKSQVIYCLLATLFLIVVIGSVYMLLPIVIWTVPFAAFFFLATADEKERWEAYRLSLSIGRAQVVMGRYAYILFVILATTLGALVLLGLLYMVEPLIGSSLNPEFSKSLGDMNWQMLLGLSVTPACALLVVLAIVLPLTFRVGMTKGMTGIPMLVIVVTIGVGAFVQSGDFLQNAAIVQFVEWMITPPGTLILLSILLFLSFVFYSASCSIAAKLYKTRQF